MSSIGYAMNLPSDCTCYKYSLGADLTKVVDCSILKMMYVQTSKAQDLFIEKEKGKKLMEV